LDVGFLGVVIFASDLDLISKIFTCLSKLLAFKKNRDPRTQIVSEIHSVMLGYHKDTEIAQFSSVYGCM
jgi:hypothetical protein